MDQNDIKNDVEKTVGDVKDAVEGAAGEASAEIKDAAGEVSSEIKTAASEASSEIKAAAGEVVSDIKAAVEDVREESAEVLAEASAAVSGKELEPANVGDAGYRAPSGGSNGKAIASLVLGVISILIGLFATGANWIGCICGVIGVVLGAMARKENQTTTATAGFVCSIIGTTISVIFYVACVVCLGGLACLGAAS